MMPSFNTSQTDMSQTYCSKASTRKSTKSGLSHNPTLHKLDPRHSKGPMIRSNRSKQNLIEPETIVDLSDYMTKQDSSRYSSKPRDNNIISFGSATPTIEVDCSEKVKRKKTQRSKHSVYSKQELLFVIQQFKDKNVRKDGMIDKLR